MTKKHFRALAIALNEIKVTSPEQTGSSYQWTVCVGKIADVCASQNPRFDRAKFIHACENGLTRKAA